MNNILKTLMITGIAATVAACTSNDVDKQVDELFAKMTQGEKLAQLYSIYLDQFFGPDGKLDTEKCAQLIPDGAGHFSQFAMNGQLGPNEMRDRVHQMQDWLMNNTPNGIPALFHEEALSGINGRDATIYPQQIGLACSFNTQLAKEKTWQTATDLRRMGGFLALSPMVDVVRTPSFNRLEESYGEDAYLGAAMGVAFVEGLQHGNLKEGVAACSKHFLGYGGGGDAGKKELMEEILLPHEAIIRVAGSQVVMTGYHAVDGVKCVANSQLQQEILRDYLQFDGLMVSDYDSIEQVDDSLDDVHRAAAAINAGNDVDFPKGVSYKTLPQAIEMGLVSQETFDRAVKRVLKLKAQVGLLDKNPVLFDKGNIQFDTPQERQTAYQLATQSVVLLKNNGVLPLKAESNIALTGPNANSFWSMCGDYSYPSMTYFWMSSVEDGTHPKVVTLKDGMQSRLPQGSSLAYSRGCDWTEVVETVVDKGGDPRAAYMYSIQNRMVDSGEEADMEHALAMAAKSDVIVAAVGENVILCGENRDRMGLRLPGRQEEFVQKLCATGKPVVLVIFGGRAQVIEGLADKCAAVIQAWYPGEEGGNALADILYGNVSPSGKLSVSYPATEIYEPVCYNYGIQDDPRIAYPFGYGLSYTTFEYSNLNLDPSAAVNADSFKLSFDLTNSGSVDATEIVQIYLSPLERSAKLRPIQLQGFGRVELAAGQTKKVEFLMSPQQLGYYAMGEWNIDPGRYMIKVGASSADIRLEAEITLEGEQLTMPLRTTYFAKMK